MMRLVASMGWSVVIALLGAMFSICTKRDYIRKLTKDAKQAEKAVKGLQSMMRHLESKDFQL